ncbi:MAG: TolC family protein [Enterocloster sp.]
MNKKKMTAGLRRLAALIMAAALCGVWGNLTVLAEEQKKRGPGDEGRVQEFLGEEENAKLKDNVLEYSEIQAMIRNFNPTVQQALSNYNQTLDAYEDAHASLKLGQSGAKTDRDDAKDSGNAEDMIYYSAEVSIYRAAASTYKKMYDSMQEQSGTSSQRRIERQLTVAAQSLMISYESLSHQKDTMGKAKELYQKQYELTITKQQAGMATEADVLNARKQVLSAESAISSIEEAQGSIYDSLCYMVGRSMDGSLVIAQMPEADISRADTMNLEEDTKKAIGNNYTLMNDRHTLSASTTSGAQYKKRTMEDGEEKLTSKMKSLYEDVLQKRNELETAKTGYQKAQQTKQNADLKYSLGMLSQDQYLAEEMAYIQSTAGYKAADLAFTQSMDTYEWAVLGIADIE